MYDFDKHLSDLADQTVLCIGDLMLDEFVYGEVSRISPEAPTPVIACKRSELMVGGAGNVARNLVSLGTRCIFVGVVGNDEAGRALTEALTEHPLIEFELVVDAARTTTRKVRFVSEHHSTHLLRADWESAGPIDTAAEDALIGHAIAALPRAGAVVLSDYAKGALTPRVIRAVIDAANIAGKPVVVDPKGRDYSIYRGATIITPNRQELAEATHSPAKTDDEIAIAADELRDALEAEAVLVTRSEDGMTLVNDGAPVHIPAYPVRVRDVSGAGDTVVAVVSAMLAMEADFEAAMRAANAAASVVVGKRGTATLSVAELRARILPAASLAPEEKIVFDWADLDRHLDPWRRSGLRIGFTNGCFDLLHPGHVRLLAAARAACDRLVLGLNSDASVTRLKGEGRPVQPAQARAEVLAALEAVDLVVVFDQDTPLDLIAQVKPTVLVKGGDYTRETVVGHELVEALGGEVILVDLVPGHSTTSIVQRSRNSNTV
ncbi:D-glycero-beta-D-manno-heptose-7-phosphate kinase [Pseudolabrys taiwanensis]|uniref:Bifunctional protein HldE n=1 Tax=Pseudolabrys taiwanensis TaxID=331696 RepID=A0A346A3M1_9HYPH|nr:D-glycero-beta-D-manno-heptose-7-phosphate kinase [Pseudolabrys taiwanensis]AXK83768.1 D-glycero-beta-D-manno-heptose-7-phosphate kinase [Pseudolabrys taiwanensis]